MARSSKSPKKARYTGLGAAAFEETVGRSRRCESSALANGSCSSLGQNRVPAWEKMQKNSSEDETSSERKNSSGLRMRGLVACLRRKILIAGIN